MMLKKRQYYGFTGFHVPSIPKAPRSARGRVHKKKVEDGQICAFELLASLAGKLLQESESSASSNASEANNQPAICDDVIKQEHHEEKLLKKECPDQGGCEESILIPQFMLANSDQKFKKESPHAESDYAIERSSVVMNSEYSVKANSDEKSLLCKSKSMCGSFPGKVEGGSPISGEYGSHVEHSFSRQRRANGLETGGLTINSTSCSNDPRELCTKFPALVNSDNNIKLPSCKDSVPNASILKHRNDAKLGIRDDDENLSRFTKLNKNKAFRPPMRVGDRRIRKLLTSKYWKVAPKLKDCCELSKVASIDGGMKPLYRKRKRCYNRERYHHDTHFKRRKFSVRSLVVTSDGGFSSESVCNSPEKGISENSNNSAAKFHGANGVSSSVIGHQASFYSKDSHVKLSIKSFSVPEFFIEVPENAKVGLLKRTVMDAVTAILGGGLRVGVSLHGNKIGDDNRTLLQTGITSKENLDTLGFILEPNPVLAPSPVCTEQSPVLLLPSDTLQQISRSPVTSVLDSGICDVDAPDSLPLTNPGNYTSNNNPAPPHTDIITDKPLSDSRALVCVSPASVEPLTVVPVNQKCKRSELVQRRTRRPFSVAEVEALVQAVEDLGTGRWRDVKLRSFENADHRTYVDLKDKWKTLVHTAKIAPQQRRGEPVPQELLDRVLAAHAYWSQNQAKQHSKNQAAILKITEAYPIKTEGTQM